MDKNVQYQISWEFIQWEPGWYLCTDRWTDGDMGTYMSKPIDTFYDLHECT